MSEENKENDETEREDCEEEEEEGEEGGKGDNSAAKTPVSLLQVPPGKTNYRFLSSYKPTEILAGALCEKRGDTKVWSSSNWRPGSWAYF